MAPVAVDWWARHGWSEQVSAAGTFGGGQWLAWPAGTDPDLLARAHALAREGFLSSGDLSGTLRSMVAESWARCVHLDPDGPPPPVELTDDELAGYRATHPLDAVMPAIRKLLVEDAAQAGLLVAVSDVHGRLLWVEGSADLRRRAESMHFVEGALWSEAAAGTNAPGTSLVLDQPVQIYGAEHLMSPVTGWSCTAAPLHGPDGALIGSLDITGTQEAAAPHTLRLVKVAAAAVEAELRLLQHAVPRFEVGATLRVLGVSHAELRLPYRSPQLIRPRHGELLLVLSESPGGLSGGQLELALHDDVAAQVTVRAELSRLRAMLAGLGGPDVPTIHAKPYRVSPGLVTDAAQVRDALARRDVRSALARYAGPILPLSQAPAVVHLREQLDADVRQAVLTSGDANLVWEYTVRPEQAYDLDAWQACRTLTEPGTPRHAAASDKVRRLDAELGS